MCWPPRASIERTDRMLLFIGPVSVVVGHRQELGLCPLLHWLAQERNWVWTRGSVIWRAVDCIGSPFSQAQWDRSKSVSVLQKVAIYGPREIRMVLDHTQTERGKRVACWLDFPLQGVHRLGQCAPMAKQVMLGKVPLEGGFTSTWTMRPNG
jgi:hypothetical protein